MNLKQCLNWKVIGGLAVVGVGIFIVQPSLIGRVLPLLLLAACPLSMLFMMGGMGKMGGIKQDGGNGAYTCPMHPDVHSDQPGKCPRCGMHLVQSTPKSQVQAALPAGARLLSRDQHMAELKGQLNSMQMQQAALAREVARLESVDAPVVREAKAIAGAADADTRDHS